MGFSKYLLGSFLRVFGAIFLFMSPFGFVEGFFGFLFLFVVAVFFLSSGSYLRRTSAKIPVAVTSVTVTSAKTYRCPYCGKEVMSDQRFCKYCGRRINQ
jgi:hypothetical protein